MSSLLMCRIIDMDSESERRRIDEQAASLNSQPSVGDHSIAASGPNVGQPQVPMDKQFMAQMGEFMKRLVGAVQPTPPTQPANPSPVQKSPIERVRKYGAEDFKGLLTDDSPAAEYWLERTERIMEQIHCSEVEKLECAVSLLQESAYQWWTTVKSHVDGEAIDWPLFLWEFREKYIGDAYVEARRREFLQLQQRHLSVFEYEKEFLRLSKYYPALISTKEEKCKRFEQGLNSDLKMFLVAINSQSSRRWLRQ